MSDNINKMTDKQLRNEVQLLRDELAIMKRKFEDIIYNLDTDNFSQRVVKQGKDMYSKIEQTADKISLQAEKITDNEKKMAEFSVTAESIRSEVSVVKDDVASNKSLIEQTANGIETTVKSVVSDQYIKDKLGDEYVTNTTFETHFNIHADGIYSEVNETREYVDSLSGDINVISSSVSSIRQTANNISTEVSDIKAGKIDNYTMFEQTPTDFIFYGTTMKVSAAIVLTDNNGNDAFSIFHDQSSNSGSNGAVYMWGKGDYVYRPVIIGNESQTESQGIYLYDNIEKNHIATRGWVRENAGSGGTGGYAVFG